MHQIAEHLPEYDCWFSQIFTDAALVNAIIDYTPILDKTIVSNTFRNKSEAYLKDFRLNIDYRAKKNQYDLIVFCSDLVTPRRLLNTKTVWVQEGMIDDLDWKSKLVKHLGLPRYLAGNTSLNGTSNLCDLYFVASEGFKTYLADRGADTSKLLVTGIPNYDNLRKFEQNDFPHRGYVMVATSDIRETFRTEDRSGFLKKAVEIAAGRRLLFKLHPNELYDRALQEIRALTPADTLVFQSGNTNEMIANCVELITQYSTVVYVGIALGKKVHSYFDLNLLERLTPIQNNGSSAGKIAQMCRQFIEFDGKKEAFVKQIQDK
jgi:hypothetical protein